MSEIHRALTQQTEVKYKANNSSIKIQIVPQLSLIKLIVLYITYCKDQARNQTKWNC